MTAKKKIEEGKKRMELGIRQKEQSWILCEAATSLPLSSFFTHSLSMKSESENSGQNGFIKTEEKEDEEKRQRESKLWLLLYSRGK